MLLEIKISALSLWWNKKQKRKTLCTGKGQVQASNGSFCQLSFVSTECYIPFSGDEDCSCLQKNPGWFGVGCRHFKVILLLHLCLCCSSAYFQFAVVLGKRFDSWFRMCTPRRFQEGFRQRDKACLFMLLCSMCSVAIIHTPHCASTPGFMKVSPIPIWWVFWQASSVPWGSQPVAGLSLLLPLFPTLYMIPRKIVAWKAQEKLKLQWKSQL